MDQSNNIVAGFNRLWLASALPALVPGGLQWSKEHMKGNKIPVRPYAQVWVDHDGEPVFDSGLSYIQAYGIDLTVWCGSDNTVLKAVDAACDALLAFSTKFESAAAGSFLTEGSTTIQVETVSMASGAKLASAGPGQEETRANQQNVGTISRRWKVTLNETRSAA